MFNVKTMTYGYDDISIRPSDRSFVRHRSQCVTMKGNNLPIFTAPMSTVIDERNYSIFSKNHIIHGEPLYAYLLVLEIVALHIGHLLR